MQCFQLIKNENSLNKSYHKGGNKMKQELHRFYRCSRCGNIVGMIHHGGGTLVCCGEEMGELVANTTDAAQEKHVPAITVNGTEVVVNIGSAAHPMTEEHYISWVYIQTEKGGQRKVLNPGDEPSLTFSITEDDKLLSAFAYCNLHGLWKADY